MSNSQIEAQAPWRDEEVFEALGLDAERYRTEGGAINRSKLRATILHPADYLSSDHWLNTRAALPASADHPPSQEAREYPPLPIPWKTVADADGHLVPVYRTFQLRDYIDADRKARQQEALTDAQIAAGWESSFSTRNPFCPCDLRSFTKAVRWAEHAIRAAIAKGAGT